MAVAAGSRGLTHPYHQHDCLPHRFAAILSLPKRPPGSGTGSVCDAAEYGRNAQDMTDTSIGQSASMQPGCPVDPTTHWHLLA